MKCEHGEIISKFCISDHCDSKNAAACQYCLKKNHFHLGNVETLTLKEVQDIVRILGINKTKKYKQAALKQLLANYFQALKIQINKSLETVCRSMIDRVSHSYLFNSNVLQSYKKTASRQYGKISSKQLRQLHLFNLKHTSINLQKLQEKCYIQEVDKIQKTLQSLKGIFDVYQHEIENYDKNFSTDSFFYKKILDLTQKILLSCNQNEVKQNEVKQFHFKNKLNENGKNNPQSEQINKLILDIDQPKLLSLEEYKNQRTKSSESLRSKQNINNQLLNIKKVNRQRKLSIAINSQKVDAEENKEDFSDENSSTHDDTLHSYDHSFQVKSPKSPMNKIEQLYKKQSANLKLKNHSYNIEDQNHHQILIRIQEPSKIGQIIKQIPPNQLNQSKQDKSSLLNSQIFHWKQCNSIVLDENPQESQHKMILDNKKIKFPPTSDHQNGNLFENREEIKKKIVRFEINDIKQDEIKTTQSPIFRKKYQNKKNMEELQLKKITSHSSHNDQHQKSFLHRKNSSYQDTNLNLDQMKSLALLLQALKLPSDKALIYLRKSFQYCQQNLSTAEYLSYILIQQNHPKQCLELCNFMINKILANTCNYSFSVHIINNKAAALNLLGRFSQTIQFLQKILQHIQKDTLYKNIADAYCALGISEKSIINYQKCIALNKKFDQAFYNLAVCLYSQHHYEETLEMVSQAIKLNSDRDEYIQLYRNTKTKLS